MRDCDVLYLPLQLNSHLNMANKELNRLKVVPLKRRKQTNGLASYWERTK